VSQATTSLDTWEDKGAAVEKQMDQVAHSLTGAPVVSDIQGMSSSLDEFGVKTVDTAALVDTEAAGLSSAFNSIGLAIAGAFTVNQIIGFVGGVMDAASEVGDLSAKLGISTEAVQRFKFAAEQGGTTLDSVGRSIQTMNNKLSEGGKGTIAALDALGLELDDLRASGPEQAFIDIADAIAGIADPMERTRLAMEVFGKSGSENMQMFLEGVERVGSETAVMSDDTIRRLKAAQDSWTSWMNTITITSAEAIASMLKVGDSWQNFGIAAATAAIPIPGIRDKVGALVDGLKDFDLVSGSATQAASDLGAMVATVPVPVMAVSSALQPVAIEGKRVDLAIRAMNDSLNLSVAQLGLVEPKLGTLSQATANMARGTDSLAAATRQAAEATDVWNSGLTFTSEVVGELPAQLEHVASAIDQVTKAQAPAGPQMGTSHGNVPVNIGNWSFPMGIEQALDQYTKRYGTISAAGMMGGGSNLPDFYTWAKSQGLASNAPAFPAGGVAGGAPINQTINMNGLLGTNDPATRNLVKTLVGDAMAESLRGQRLLSSA